MTIRLLSAPLPRKRAISVAAVLDETGWPVVRAVSAFARNERKDLWQVEVFCAPEYLPESDKADEEKSSPAIALASWLEQLAGHESHRGNNEDLGFHLAHLPQIDWVQKVQQGLSPVQAGRFFIHGAHDRGRKPANAVNIEIEAGLAFGSGHHGTTRGCLLALDWLLKTRRLVPGIGPAARGGRGMRVLDVGTGSGVLAIAAARAHLRRIVLVGDVDPVATATAAANARRNGAPHIRFYTAPGTRHPMVQRLHAPLPRHARLRTLRPGLARVRMALAASRLPQPPYSRWSALKARKAAPPRRGGYDLIFANILSRPLIRLAPELSAHLAPGGYLILSGLLVCHERAVLNAYLPRRLQLLRRWRLQGWSTLLLRRPRTKCR